MNYYSRALEILSTYNHTDLLLRIVVRRPDVIIEAIDPKVEVAPERRDPR